MAFFWKAVPCDREKISSDPCLSIDGFDAAPVTAVQNQLSGFMSIFPSLSNFGKNVREIFSYIPVRVV